MSENTMRAVVLHAAHDIRVEEWPVPTPGPDEVLLKITAAGICGSDAFFYENGPGSQDGTQGLGPLVLGHEFGGQVVAAGKNVTSLSEGDLVSSGAGIACGHCRPCSQGRTNLCLNYSTAGIHQDGGLAEFCTVPAVICESATDHGVTGDDAALAQPMAIANHSVHRGRLKEGERALVLGVGGIGMFATWIASQIGATVTAVDMSAERLELASRVGASRTILSGDDGVAEPLLEEEPFDVIYEITGAPGPLHDAMKVARRGTRVVFTGVHKRNYDLSPLRVTGEELELIGSAAHVRAVDLPDALRHVAARAEGWADVAPDVLPLDRVVPDGIVPLVERRAPHIKTLIDPANDSVRPYSR